MNTFAQNQIKYIKYLMGSSKSKDDRVDMFLELDKMYYQAGSQLSGNVYLNVHE
jgi:hypothetical protein